MGPETRHAPEFIDRHRHRPSRAIADGQPPGPRPLDALAAPAGVRYRAGGLRTVGRHAELSPRWPHRRPAPGQGPAHARGPAPRPRAELRRGVQLGPARRARRPALAARADLSRVGEGRTQRPSDAAVHPAPAEHAAAGPPGTPPPPTPPETPSTAWGRTARTLT